MCDCQVCKDIRHLRECGVSEDFMNRWIEEGTNAAYNEAILTGTWPNSVEILEGILEELKNK